MPPPGMNLIVRIYRQSYPQDDSIGGAVPSGTVLFPRVWGRLQQETPTMVLLEQGVETVKLWMGVLTNDAKGVREHDILEVYEPPESPYYGEKFAIVSVEYMGGMRANDPRTQIRIVCKRREIAHTNQQG